MGFMVTRQKAIVTLRNPSDQPQDFTASLTTLLELPAGSARAYAARSPWKSDSAAIGYEYSCERAALRSTCNRFKC